MMPARKTTSPSSRIADRRDAIANGWAKSRHLTFNAQCDDAVAADYAPPARLHAARHPGHGPVAVPISLRLDLGDDALEALADAVAHRLAERQAPAADGWMDTRAAADHLGLSTHALYRLVARREIPYSQDGPGAKCYFKRSALDAWQAG